MELSTGTKNLILFIQEDWKLLLCLTIIFILYFHYTSTFDFFENKGIKYMKPTIIVGNLGPRLTGSLSFHEFQIHMRNYFKGYPYGGYFEGRRPVLCLFDPDIIKAVMIRDFDHFTDRRAFGSNEPKYLRRNLLNLKGSEWKSVRSIMTPTFSTSRLKNMMPLIQTCSDQFVEFLEQYDKEDIDMSGMMGHFTLEVISATAFGIRTNSLSNKDSEFAEVAKKIDYMPIYKRFFIFFLLLFMPGALKYFNVSFFNYDATKKLNDMLKVTKAERRQSSIKRNDFLQIILDAAEKEKELAKHSHEKLQLDDETIDAQIILFLLAGFETSRTVLSFASHVLATEPELQEKLREHINQVTEGKEINYETLAQLDYLEAFINETLRLYSPVSRVDREVTKPYVLPGSSIKLDVGQMVSIPVYAFHTDPDIYPEPQEFRPERFLKDDKTDRPSNAFLPFGAGPRNCIGLRFAMISIKIVMVALLKKYKFKTCAKTQKPVQFNKRAIFLKSSKGLYVRIEKI